MACAGCLEIINPLQFADSLEKKISNLVSILTFRTEAGMCMNCITSYPLLKLWGLG